MGFIIVVVFMVAAIWLSWNQKQAANRSWARVGERFGLDFKPGSLFSHPMLTGDVEGMSVMIDVYSQSSGNNSRNYFTRYEVRHLPVGPPLRLSKQGTFSMFGRLIGRTDVEIGDPFFDERVVIDSDSPADIQAFLTPARQAAVLDLLGAWSGGEFTQNSVQVRARGVERDPNRLHGTLLRLIETAKIMGEPFQVDAILEHQRQGRLGEAIDELHELNQHQPNVFTEMLEAEALVEMGRHDEAGQIFGELQKKLPEDPTVGRWQQVSQLPPPPPPPPPPPGMSYPPPPPPPVAQVPSAEPVVATAAPSVSLDQQSVIDDLFAADRMSWEIVEYFEATYQNAQVSWRGEVTAVNTYLHDADFGEGPAMKATVLLGRSGNSDFISNEVHAMVQFDEDTAIERGSEVAFTGTLVHVDRFSRKVYVQFATPSA